MRRFFVVSLIFLVSVVSIDLISSNQAQATNISNWSPNPTATQIPWLVRNALEQECGHTGRSPGFTSWVSKLDANSTTTFKVDAGTASIVVSYHFGSLVCESNSAVPETRGIIVNTSANPAGTVTNISACAFLCGTINDHGGAYQSVGNWRRAQVDYRYSPTGGFTTSGNYTISITTRGANRFTTGAYLCITNGQSIGGWGNLGDCPDEVTNFPVYVEVIQPSSYTQTPDIHKVTSDTSTTPTPGSSVTVNSHISRFGGGPYPPTYTQVFQWRLGSGSWSTYKTFNNASGVGHRNAAFTIPSGATNGQQYCMRSGVRSGTGQSTPTLTQNNDWRYSAQTCYSVYKAPVVAPSGAIQCLSANQTRITIRSTYVNSTNVVVRRVGGNSINLPNAGITQRIEDRPFNGLSPGSSYTFRLESPSFANTSVTCTTALPTLSNPTCVANTTAPSFNVGQAAKMTYVDVSNNDTFYDLDITSVSLSINSTPVQNSGSTPSTANIIVGAPDQTFIQNSNTSINAPGPYTATWSVAWTAGGTSGILPCPVTVTINLQPIGCTFSVEPSTIEINSQFRVIMTLDNPNPSGVTIKDAKWDISTEDGGAILQSGLADSLSSGTITAGAFTAPPGNVSVFSGDISIAVPGRYDLRWVATNTANGRLIECGSDWADDGSDDPIPVGAIPYVRFYGNDVYSGGGYGETCSLSAVDARANGRFTGDLDRSSYKGSASELAVFAVGQISGVLSAGRNSNPLTALDILSFANINPAYLTSATTLEFGGGFGGQLCAPDFPDDSSWGVYSALTDGDFTSGPLTIGGATINNGQRTRLMVNGDLTITDDIEYNSSAWGDDSDIPLLRIYATGNIYIDKNVTRLDGLYSAGDTIYTCTNGGSPYVTDGTPAQDAATVSNCSNKLTINGAFVAKYVELLRTNGSVILGGVAEGPGGPNIAEVFLFSPEMYIALLDEARNSTTEKKFNSILSLPPAF